MKPRHDDLVLHLPVTPRDPATVSLTGTGETWRWTVHVNSRPVGERFKTRDEAEAVARWLHAAMEEIVPALTGTVIDRQPAHDTVRTTFRVVRAVGE